MSDIPYNYRKYIDDVTKMRQRGAISAGEQIASPSSAGSRGLAKTTQFTKDPTQMKMGHNEGMTPLAESMIEIRTILNRIDGVNAPVQEDAHNDWSKLTNALIKKYGEDKAKVITDFAQISTDSGPELMKNHGLTPKGDSEEDMEQYFQKFPYLRKMYDTSWMDRLINIAGEGPDYGTPVKMEDAGDIGNEIAKMYDTAYEYINDSSDNPSDIESDYKFGYNDDDSMEAEDLAAAFRKDLKTGMALQKQLQAQREKEGREGDWDPFNPESMYHNELKALMSKNKGESAVKEDLAQMAQKVEQDHEVQMARSDLYKAAKYSIKLHDRLKNISEQEGLEGWVAAKITKASDYLSSVYHYMDYEMMSSEEMTESRTKIVQAIKTKSEQPQPTYKETISKKYQAKLEEMSKKPVLEDFVGKPISEEEFDRLAEKQDACYHKVKARYKVWPSAYASGALVQCRKKGAANWGNKSKK
jgi:hypothetical protein